jgi:hypothetical protein
MKNMHFIKNYLLIIILSAVTLIHARDLGSIKFNSGDVVFRQGQQIGYLINTNEPEVVFTALSIFKRDFMQVFLNVPLLL